MPRKGSLTFQQVFFITALFFIFSTFFSLWLINKGLKPTLVNYAEHQTKKLASLVINDALKDEELKKNDNLTINGNNFVFDTDQMVKKQQEIVNIVQQNMLEMEKGNISEAALLTDVQFDKEKTANQEGIVYSIPIGQATNNALLGNLGPNVPIKFNVVGSVKSDLKTKMEDVGINYVVVKAYVELTVDIQIIIPFATKVTSVKQDILIAMAGFEGEVPQYYNGSNKGTSPAVELPKDSDGK